MDHTGVTNPQLVKKETTMAVMYQGKREVKQNSVELAWNLLMDDRYSNFRDAIHSSEAELKRFRQLIVNSVMATDMMDNELKALRSGRRIKVRKKLMLRLLPIARRPL